MISTTQSRKARRDTGLHEVYIGLICLFRKNGYAVYANDTYTSGVIETPHGWIDHWIRYASAGDGRRFAYDAPEKITPYVRRMLEQKVIAKLEKQEVKNDD